MYAPRSLLALSILAIAATCQFTTQSDRFGLLVVSDNSTINGTLLGACHEGAAIQGLCITSATPVAPQSNYTSFYHNISAANPTYNVSDSPGPIIYKWTAGGNLAVQSSLRLIFSPGSNVAVPIFSPGTTDTGYFSFDACNNLYIQRNLDDTVIPPRYLETPAKDQNWYICLTRYAYLYETLAWRAGGGSPQNPSCQKVTIKRVTIQ